MKYSYVLSVVIMLDKNINELFEKKRRNELFNMLKENCKEFEMNSWAVFNIDVEFRECNIDIPEERGKTYSLIKIK